MPRLDAERDAVPLHGPHRDVGGAVPGRRSHRRADAIRGVAGFGLPAALPG